MSIDGSYVPKVYLTDGGDRLVIADGGKIDFDDGISSILLETGTYQSTADGGVALSSTNTRPFSFLGDDAGAALTGDVRQVLSRVLLTIDRTAGTVNAIRGQIKALNLVDSGASCVTAPVTGYLELAGTGARSIGGHCAAVRAAIEEGASGTTTIAASSYYAGFEATLNSTRTYTTTGQMAAFMCNISGGTSVWPIGFLVDTSSCTIGMQIGTCTTGLNMSGSYTDGIVFGGTITGGKCVDFGGVTLAAGSNNNLFSYGDSSADKEVTITDYFFPIRMNVASVANPGTEKLASLMFLKFNVTTAHQANLDIQGIGLTVTLDKNVGYAHAIEGLVDVSTSCTTTTGTIIGGKFGLDFSSGATLTHGVGDNASAVCAVVVGTGTYSGGMLASCIEARKEGATTIDNGLWVNVLTGATITHGIRFTGAGTITHVMKFDDTTRMGVNTSGYVGGSQQSDAIVKLDIGGTNYYFAAFVDGSVTGEWAD